MSVKISSVEKSSPAYKAGIKSGDILLSLNGEDIMDVLDYRFYQNDERITAEVINAKGKNKRIKIKKNEYDELGLCFESYLMDEKRPCKNKCIFCFIDQLPPGLRESLYFKDDDSRLSFLFGNYITLTNITEHEIERIIRMHISPINISVHTTNPELRVRMMTNKHAGKALNTIWRFNDAGIKMNCQLVLCPGYNDGIELERSLSDLTGLENVECIAAVPVGITKYRQGLAELEPFDKMTARAVLDIIDLFGNRCIEKYGERRVYAADEFYLIADRSVPEAEYYGDFLQLENGVGMWALLKSEATAAINESTCILDEPRQISIATGKASFPLIKWIAEMCEKKLEKLKCTVFAINNEFFGERITVSGLITATDIYNQLRDKDLGDELLIPRSMLRAEGDMFLDSITLVELSEKLSVKITPISNDGYELVEGIFGKLEEKNEISL